MFLYSPWNFSRISKTFTTFPTARKIFPRIPPPPHLFLQLTQSSTIYPIQQISQLKKTVGESLYIYVHIPSFWILFLTNENVNLNLKWGGKSTVMTHDAVTLYQDHISSFSVVVFGFNQVLFITSCCAMAVEVDNEGKFLVW